MKQKLTVVYDGDPDMEVDAVIETALAKIGFKRWASGYNFPDKERDLVFERKVEE